MRTIDFGLYVEIVAGKKTRDCVLAKDDWERIEVGERVGFMHADSKDVTQVVVTDVKKFPSVASALADDKICEFVAEAVQISDAIVHYQFPAEDEAKYGVIAFRFNIVRANGVSNEQHFA